MFHFGCLCVRQSVHPPVHLSYVDLLYFHFWMITYVNVKEFSPGLVCALILRRSGLGFIISKFHQFLTELSARNKPIFSFLDDNLSKYQWVFTKLGLCIYIMEM